MRLSSRNIFLSVQLSVGQSEYITSLFGYSRNDRMETIKIRMQLTLLDKMNNGFLLLFSQLNLPLKPINSLKIIYLCFSFFAITSIDVFSFHLFSIKLVHLFVQFNQKFTIQSNLTIQEKLKVKAYRFYRKGSLKSNLSAKHLLILKNFQ